MYKWKFFLFRFWKSFAYFAQTNGHFCSNFRIAQNLICFENPEQETWLRILKIRQVMAQCWAKMSNSQKFRLGSDIMQTILKLVPFQKVILVVGV